MTNPFQNTQPAPVLQPAPALQSPAPVYAQPSSPFGQAAPAPAPVPQTQAAGPLGPLAGLGTAPVNAGSGVNAGGLLNYLVLIIPTKADYGVAKPGKPGETQTRVTADVLVIRTPEGHTGPVTLACPAAPGEPARIVTHHTDDKGNPDPSRPFIHNPATGQYLAFPGLWLFGALADKALPCLDPARPDLTMIAEYIRTTKSKTSGFNYNTYEDPKPGDWAEINATASAWLATRGQFG